MGRAPRLILFAEHAFIAHPCASARTIATMAAKNKCLAQSNKSRHGVRATKKQSNPALKGRSARAAQSKLGEQQQEDEPMEIGAKPFTAMTNSHPADEIADIREQIKELKTREAELRNALLNAEQPDRIGQEWIAEIKEWKSHRLDNDALEKHFGTEALQPFMRESIIRSIKLISTQTGKRRHHRTEKTATPPSMSMQPHSVANEELSPF
jgi:hypothetical protein